APKDHEICSHAVEMVGSPYPYLEPRFLQGQKVILSGEGTGLYDLCQEFFRAEELYPDVRIFEDSVQAAKRFAEEGAGICFANEEMVTKAPSDRLQFFVVGESMPLRHVAIIWKKTSEKDAVVQEVLKNCIDALQQEYKKHN
ncbi:MAG: LysR family transcriptional regulator substrate-binding protein, partial [Firmicutes bacterium]|nr:LysR family transcriptional regulator substrate-binding protein [Bacillota bacterium]